MKETIRFAVILKKIDIESAGGLDYRNLEMLLQCPECNGVGKVKRKRIACDCYFCCGSRQMTRKDIIVTAIGNFGDQLMYGGPKCRFAFSCLVEAIAILELHNVKIGLV